jgi:hypothetical protein
MQHAFLTNRNGLDRPRKTRSEIHKNSSHSWKNCHKPVGLLICQISQVPNKFHKPLASDLWLNSQTVVGFTIFWIVHHKFFFFALIGNTIFCWTRVIGLYGNMNKKPFLLSKTIWTSMNNQVSITFLVTAVYF